MAIAIEPKSENYVDLPLTNFPIKEDTMKRMTDVNAVLMPVVRQYNTYFADGNLAACNDLLKNNPDVLDCFLMQINGIGQEMQLLLSKDSSRKKSSLLLIMWPKTQLELMTVQLLNRPVWFHTLRKRWIH